MTRAVHISTSYWWNSFLMSWQSALVYLDDIFILSNTLEQHMGLVRQELTLPRDMGVTLKLKMCSFCSERIDYLGHVDRPGQLEIANTTMEAIQQLRISIEQGELHFFVELCNVIRRFVPNVSRIAAPLSQKFKKDRPKSFKGLTVKKESS